MDDRGPKFFPTRGHLLICTGPSCSERGSDRIYGGTWARLEKERLAYYVTGGTVRMTQSGCLGACEFGPNIACYARRSVEGRTTIEEAWYSRADIELAVDVARACHRGTEMPTKGRYDK